MLVIAAKVKPARSLEYTALPTGNISKLATRDLAHHNAFVHTHTHTLQPHTSGLTHARIHSPAALLTRNLVSSNWILMSCQQHRVTSGQSNSNHKQMYISKFFSCIQTLCLVNPQNQLLRKHKTSDTIFEELVPSVLPLLKEHRSWYCRPFHLIYRYQITEKKERKEKKGMDR